jgi:small GTP-binding protein
VKKVCMLGDPSVGKTSLIRRFVQDEFSDDYLSTIGTKVSDKELKMQKDGSEVLLHLVIWDIAGQQSFTSVSPTLFKGAQGALIICDVTRRPTLEDLNNWIFNLSKNAGKVPFVILVNKWDLVGRKAFEMADVERVAQGHESVCLSTSAKTGHNVEVAFRRLGEFMLG